MIPLTSSHDGCTFFVAAAQVELAMPQHNKATLVVLKSGHEYIVQEEPQAIAVRVTDALLLLASGGDR